MRLASVRCPNCGCQDVSESMVCSACGGRLAWSQGAQAPRTVGLAGCPGCGWENPEENRFCARCARGLRVVCPVCQDEHPWETLVCPQHGISFLDFHAAADQLRRLREEHARWAERTRQWQEAEDLGRGLRSLRVEAAEGVADPDRVGVGETGKVAGFLAALLVTGLWVQGVDAASHRLHFLVRHNLDVWLYVLSLLAAIVAWRAVANLVDGRLRIPAADQETKRLRAHAHQRAEQLAGTVSGLGDVDPQAPAKLQELEQQIAALLGRYPASLERHAVSQPGG